MTLEEKRNRRALPQLHAGIEITGVHYRLPQPPRTCWPGTCCSVTGIRPTPKLRSGGAPADLVAAVRSLFVRCAFDRHSCSTCAAASVLALHTLHGRCAALRVLCTRRAN
jgi:hypothetical protein